MSSSTTNGSTVQALLNAARALSWFCKEKPVGVFNIGAPNAWTLRGLMECIEKTVGKEFTYGNVDDTPSPFGAAQDYFMNVDKAQKAGFQVDALEKWMPNLVEELAKK